MIDLEHREPHEYFMHTVVVTNEAYYVVLRVIRLSLCQPDHAFELSYDQSDYHATSKLHRHRCERCVTYTNLMAKSISNNVFFIL